MSQPTSANPIPIRRATGAFANASGPLQLKIAGPFELTIALCFLMVFARGLFSLRDAKSPLQPRLSALRKSKKCAKNTKKPFFRAVKL
jgi:hypothetical protein